MDKFRETFIPYTVLLVLGGWGIASSKLGVAESIEAIRDLAIGVAAIIGTYQASLSLETWRLELKGKDAYGLAKEMGLAIQSISRLFKGIRAKYKPIIGESRGVRRQEIAKDVGVWESEEILEEYFPYLNFIVHIEEVKQELGELKGRMAEARLYKMNIEGLVEELASMASQLWITALRPLFGGPGLLDEKKMEEIDEILFGGTGIEIAHDKTSERITEIEDEVIERLNEFI